MQDIEAVRGWLITGTKKADIMVSEWLKEVTHVIPDPNQTKPGERITYASGGVFDPIYTLVCVEIPVAP